MSRRTTEFQTIRSEGGLLPPDLLRRVVDPAGKVSGIEPTAYGLPAGERLNEAITQSWNRLRRHWAEFRAVSKTLPEGDATTGLTNDKWSLPLLRELGFGFLPTTPGPTIDGKTYAISRFAGNTAIHLVGCGVSLDRRAAGVRGAAQSNPHGLVQEFLNRSTAHLWAIVSSGLSFRVLRDNQALSRQSFLEFDLEAMFDGEVYSDFVLLWLIAHATRFLPRNDGRADACWLETWSKEAAEQGVAALTDLRGGVEKALEILGQGFVSHPKNTALRDALRKGEVKLSDFHGQLMRIVYRFIFLFVAEDRELEGIPLLHPQDKSDKARLARERYAAHYGTSRIRELASRIKGSRHSDLWRQFQLLVGAVSGGDRFATMRDALALPSLGSMLWNPASTALLNGPGLGDPGTELANVDFLEALRHLAFIRKDRILRPVDYKNLGSEEFGGVYESFLALTPQISSDGARFTFAEFAGNERKTSGSYYTPDSLVQCLLDSALEPVVQERLGGKTGKEAEKVLLAIKVCDKAVGSGHFLVGAAHRLARHLARVRALAAGESEPSPLLYQTALRDVIGHCLYGVDINSMSVELCKVTLWLEALEPGKPLSFLDHHIRCGNSLLGATPELIKGGIPDEAYEAIEGDDKEACSGLKKKNKRENPKLGEWFMADEAVIRDRLYQAAAAIDEMSDSRPEDIRRKEAAFRAAQSNYDFGKAWDLANLWCAAFVIKKHFPKSAVPNSAISNPQSAIPAALAETQTGLFGGTEEAPKAKAKKTKAPSRAVSEIPIGITTQHLRDFVEGGALPDGLLAEAKRVADQYQFFHYHLAFPEVFAQGGFDVSLGNPPWERAQFEERAFFADKRPDIFQERNQSRRRFMILELATNDPNLYATWELTSREADAEAQFLRASGGFPLSAVDKFNLYAVFLELSTRLVSKTGRVGLIVKAGFVTDTLCAKLFAALMEQRRVAQVIEFENKAKIFSAVHPQERFALVVLSQGFSSADFCFDNLSLDDIADPDRHIPISFEDICRLSPNSKNCPKFQSKQEYEITKVCYAQCAPLKRQSSSDNAWGVSVDRYINVSDFSDEIVVAGALEEALVDRPKSGGGFLPLYEGKLFHQFDHRYSTYTSTLPEPVTGDLTDKSPSQRVSFCRFIPRATALRRNPRLERLPAFLAVRDITNRSNERGVIAALIPSEITAYTVRVVQLEPSTAERQLVLLSVFNSFVFDYLARQRIGGTHLSNDVIEQLPAPPFESIPKAQRTFLIQRAFELTYTAWDLEAFAQDCGWPGPPFRWDEERRFLLRCELDAAFFHLYLGPEPEWRQQPEALTKAFPTPRHAADYILDTFPIVKRKDEARTEEKNAAGEVVKPGRYITKDNILEIYDALAESMQTGHPYQTRLNPPPADASCRHPKKKIGILAFGSLVNEHGRELLPKIIMRIKTPTPFGVEYARISQTRGGAPTLVPHEAGAPVQGEILVLEDTVSVEEARNMLWRRERRKEGSGETYVAGTSPNTVLVREWTDSPCVEHVLYTDFHPEGKVAKPEAAELAKNAIQSAKAAKDGMDGITYLKNNLASGVKTKLTADYEAEILKQSKANSLQEALGKAKTL